MERGGGGASRSLGIWGAGVCGYCLSKRAATHKHAELAEGTRKKGKLVAETVGLAARNGVSRFRPS